MMAIFLYDLYHLLEQAGIRREAVISLKTIDGGRAYLIQTNEMTVRVKASAPLGLLPNVEVLWRVSERGLS